VIFLLKYHKNPLSHQGTEHKNKKRGKKRKKKGGRKRKAPSVSSNKGEVNILRVENTSTSKYSF
jgi:hypothetical protein